MTQHVVGHLKDVDVSVYRNSHDTSGVTRSLSSAIKRIKDGGNELAEKTHYCNVLAVSEPTKYRTYKEFNLPAVTFSGTFPQGKRFAEHLSDHSGLGTIDIDGLNPSDVPVLLAELAQMPQVVLAFVSPSGAGIKVIVRVDPIPTDATEHKGAYAACVEFFGDLATEFGFQIDTSGSDCSRLCFLAYDPLAIVHDTPVPIQWDRDEYLTTLQKQREKRTHTNIEYEGEADIKALDFIDPDEKDEAGNTYDNWLAVGMACYHAGLPVEVWIDWSRSSTHFDESEIRRKWNTFDDYTGEKITWGSVVHRAKENGYEPPRSSIQRPPKLQRNTDTENEPTENLDENRENREAATDRFMEPDETDTLHILLVKDSTGTGKSHTIIAKAQQHGKRTLAQVPHTDLAKQAVDLAFELGYKDPFHLLGRGHNWNKSRIELIPPQMRTKDLFEKNNCIMFDAVQEYTEQRLAPRTYCEHQCDFRDGCLHLAQYKGLGQRDFLVSCTPNLLFDLNMRGYLQSLVTATDEPSDEDLAIDAMLGTESEATENFDFATLDDYGINALYTDITFSQKEFKALKKAWRGTPTADFAKLLLKAFEKKKPHKIVKALRKAFESTAEYHTEIREALTQHARVGTVQYAERPKGSKETQRMLAEKQMIYDDGGTQFIPVDFDAYKELIDKGIPTSHPEKLQTQEIGEQVRVPHTPTHALIAGVPRAELTPVWQKGATPIVLLDIFLKSIGNDKNAPINRTFRAGDPPEAVLTFSIPPQAPIGILPQIALLSATTDPADTQRAFDGQAVTFSEHSGGNLEWKDGVQVCQFTDARLTSASVFEYPTDADGKRKLQEHPTALTQTAEKRIAKMNDWAKQTDGLTAFVSYKEFTEAPFFEAVNAFDIVSHFDTVAGLNFDGLKFLVVFGYPKSKHKVVMEQSRKQYASDSEPLPKGDPTLCDDNGEKISEYMQLTEDVTVTENGITITERRYKNPRLEKVRHQLSTEKIDQAIGRARLPVWTDTTTLVFTDAPIGNITERATLFSADAFNLAETPDGLAEAMERIAEAEASGDVQAVMDTKGVSERTAYRQTAEPRKQTKAEKAEKDAELLHKAKALIHKGASQRGAAAMLSISLGKLQSLLKSHIKPPERAVT